MKTKAASSADVTEMVASLTRDPRTWNIPNASAPRFICSRYLFIARNCIYKWIFIYSCTCESADLTVPWHRWQYLVVKYTAMVRKCSACVYSVCREVSCIHRDGRGRCRLHDENWWVFCVHNDIVIHISECGTPSWRSGSWYVVRVLFVVSGDTRYRHRGDTSGIMK